MSSSSQPASSSSHKNQDALNNFMNNVREIHQNAPSASNQDDQNNSLNNTILSNSTRTHELTLSGIRQYFVDVEREDWKVEVLSDLFEILPTTRTVTYCKDRGSIDFIVEKMREQDFAMTPMHGGMEPTDCHEIIREFRSGSSPNLITTDAVVLAYNIVIPEVEVILNYDLPELHENYIHRVGRSGRFVPKRLAINFVTEEDKTDLKDIEILYDTEIQELPADASAFL